MKACRLLALLLTTLALAPAWAQSPATPVPKATTTGPDMTGMYLVPSEMGWGVNVIQQEWTLLVTLFVYAADGKPTWFVGPDVGFVSGDSAGGRTYAGSLYQTNGPHFSAPAYDESAVRMDIVGTIVLRFSSPGAATLTYTVNGASVTKSVVPYTFRTNNLSGLYIGSASAANPTPQCMLPLRSGDFDLVAFDIGHSEPNVTIRLQDQSLETCMMNGQVTAQGKQSEINGTYTCTGGASGRFAIRRMEAGIDGFSGAFYALSDPACSNAPVAISGARTP